MGRMSARLAQSAHHARLHTSLLREVLLARRLSALGFDVLSEVPTPRGRTCDLVATRGELALHIHVKCMDSSDRPHQLRSTRIPDAIRALEHVSRRLLVEVEWKPGMSSRALDSTAERLRSFLNRAAVGDECVVRSNRGTIRARCRVRSSRDTQGVAIIDGISEDPRALVERARRLLRRAREQFLPGGENIIVCYGPKQLQWVFEQALMGIPVERWDEFPRRGERVALGCADDGFWRGCRMQARSDARGVSRGHTSRIVAWGSLESARDDSMAWIRAGVGDETRSACSEIFRQIHPVRGAER